MLGIFQTAFLLIGVLATQTSLVRAGDIESPEDLEKGDKARVYIKDLRPTQFNVGMFEVELRAKLLKAKIAKGDWEGLKEYLKDRRAQVVLGPKNGLYVVDGHHLTLASLKAGLEYTYVKVLKDYSDLTLDEFWKKMAEKEFVYPFDLGKKRSPRSIPKNFKDLTDDPYRTLVYLIEKAGGIEEVPEAFFEFQWANLLRKAIPGIDLSTERSRQKALNQGLTEVRKKKYEDVPGYIGLEAPRSCRMGLLIKNYFEK